MKKKSEVLVIAVFANTSKPTSVEFYMTDFIQEVNSLQSNGILHNGRPIDFSLGAFICDAPARLYTNYMHLVCLGVIKSMLTFLKQGPRICKLSNAMVQDISYILISLSGKKPSEFIRQPRSLTEIEHWNVTEFRQILLCTGPLALKSVIDKDLYQHFLTLHVSISILLNSCNEYRAFYLNFAEQLPKYFVKNALSFYGASFTVNNVHVLLHIHEDVRNFSCSLNDISAFESENVMKTLKKMVRNDSKPVAQVAKRLSEIENAENLKEVETFVLSFRQKDSCFQVANAKMCFLKSKISEHCYECDIFKLAQTESLYVIPIDSKRLGIGLIRSKSKIGFEVAEVQKKDLKRKICILPLKNRFALFPMLHNIENFP